MAACVPSQLSECVKNIRHKVRSAACQPVKCVFFWISSEVASSPNEVLMLEVEMLLSHHRVFFECGFDFPNVVHALFCLPVNCTVSVQFFCS